MEKKTEKMIDLQNLRRGNYVTTLSGSKVKLPTGIIEMFGESIGLGLVNLYDYKKDFFQQVPRKEKIIKLSEIQLTPVVLRMLGFEEINLGNKLLFEKTIKEDYLSLSFQFEGNKLINKWLVIHEYENDNGNVDEVAIEIAFEPTVNELQNYWYFTTKLLRGEGEELKFK